MTAVKTISAAVVVAFALAGPAVADEAPPAVPVARAPFHAPAFRNSLVSIVDAFVPAGREASWHRHAKDFVYALVREAPLVLQSWGEPEQRVDWPRGHVGFGAFSKTPLVHRAQNVGAGPLRMVGFELVEDAPAGFAPSQRPAPWRVILDNERLRGWRLTLAPKEAAPGFVQTAPSVRIVVDGGEIVDMCANAQNLVLHSGDFHWRERGDAGALLNAGVETVDLVEFEVR